jgi:hypothetical protein
VSVLALREGTTLDTSVFLATSTGMAACTPYTAARRSNAAGLIWPSVEWRRRWLARTQRRLLALSSNADRQRARATAAIASL